MAKLESLPVIYYCENNNYSMGTSVERHSAGGNDFHKKFTFIPGISIQGFDVFEVREAV